MRALTLVAGCGFWIFCAQPASADPTTCAKLTTSGQTPEAEARALFDDASAREAADPEGALERYACAQERVDRPAIALRIGTVAERLGQRELAVAQFKRYLALAGNDAPDRQEMLRHIEALTPKRTEGPTPPPPPSQVRPASPWLPLGIAGVGLVAVGTGVVFLALASKNDSDVHALPPGTPWAGVASDTYDAARRDQLVGIVSLSVGLVAAGGGLVWFFATRKPGQPRLHVGAMRDGARLTLDAVF